MTPETGATPATATMGPTAAPLAASSYQQSLQLLNSVVIAGPDAHAQILTKPGQLTRVTMQAGRIYTIRARCMCAMAQRWLNLPRARAP